MIMRLKGEKIAAPNKSYADVIDKIIEKIKAEDFKQGSDELDKFFDDPIQAAETSLADRYKLIYMIMRNRLPKWKRAVLEETTDDRISDDLARDVIALAESEDWVEQLDELE